MRKQFRYDNFHIDGWTPEQFFTTEIHDAIQDRGFFASDRAEMAAYAVKVGAIACEIIPDNPAAYFEVRVGRDHYDQSICQMVSRPDRIYRYKRDHPPVAGEIAAYRRIKVETGA